MQQLKSYFITGIALVFLIIPMQTIGRDTDTLKTALLLIDIQYFYFPGSKGALVNPEAASANAALLLKKFRDAGELVVHVKHNAKTGGEIYPDVAPLPDEKVITKNHVNSFLETDLLSYLQSKGIRQLVIGGMMTHMCVEGSTRAAADLGFECIVIGDACATRDLAFEDKTIPADQVHNATLSTIAYAYGRVMKTAQFLEEFKFK